MGGTDIARSLSAMLDDQPTSLGGGGRRSSSILPIIRLSNLLLTTIRVDHLPDHALEPLQPRRHALRRPLLLGPGRVDARLRLALLGALAAGGGAVALQLGGAAGRAREEDPGPLGVLLLVLVLVVLLLLLC